MTHILFIVGCKNAGKTRLTELLVPRLTARVGGVGTVKNAERGHFDWEREGTDTHRHFTAGSAVTSIISGDVFALESREPDHSIDVMRIVESHYRNIALVLAEGFSSTPGLKIEVLRTGYTDRVIAADLDCLATYGDAVIPRSSPHFAYGEEEHLSDYIVANLDRLARVD